MTLTFTEGHKVKRKLELVQLLYWKWLEVTRTSRTVDCVKKMAAKSPESMVYMDYLSIHSSCCMSDLKNLLRTVSKMSSVFCYEGNVPKTLSKMRSVFDD